MNNAGTSTSLHQIFPHQLKFTENVVMERTHSRNDTPHKKLGVLTKESYSDRSINFNRQLHKIVTYYWISKEHVQELL